MVSAEECGRSLRGAAALIGRRADARGAFDTTVAGLWRSCAAISLTGPALVVLIGLARAAAGTPDGAPLFGDPRLVLLVAGAHAVAFFAPAGIVLVLARGAFLDRFGGWAIAHQWVSAFGSYGLALAGALHLAGLVPAGLAWLLLGAFGILAGHAQWFAARLLLGVRPWPAIGVAILGPATGGAIAGLCRMLIAGTG